MDKIIHSREIEPRRDVDVRDSKTYKVRVSGLRRRKNKLRGVKTALEYCLNPTNRCRCRQLVRLVGFPVPGSGSEV